MVLRPSSSFALAKGLEHFINILLGPAGPPQHLPCDVFDVLHGHVILVGRRIINMREPRVVHHACSGRSLRAEGSGGSPLLLRCGSLVSGLQRRGPYVNEAVRTGSRIDAKKKRARARDASWKTLLFLI